MNKAVKILLFPALLVTILAAVLLPISGFSGYLFTEKFPLLSISGMAFPFILLANGLCLLFWLLFKSKRCLIPLLAMLVCASPILTYCPLHIRHAGAINRTDALPGGYKLVSYNVLGYGIGSNNDGTENNPIIKWLAATDADVICLQESNNAVLQRILKDTDALAAYPYCAVGKGENAILSKFPIESYENIDFEGDGGSGMHAVIIIDGEKVSVYNLHLQSFQLNQENIDATKGLIVHPNDSTNYAESKKTLRKLLTASVARADQARMLDKLLENDPLANVIVCGDFNDTPLSFPHRIVSRHLDDAHTRSGCGPGISYHKDRLYFRIDQTFLSSAYEAYACGIDHSVSESDHFPLITIFTKAP